MLDFCGNDHLKNLIDSKSKNVPGWNINVANGVWNRNGIDTRRNCTGWFGFENGQTIGSISTSFSGKGRARLEFRNCEFWAGYVQVILDGVEIVRSKEDKTNKREHIDIDFNYNHGSLLEIKEINVGIIEVTKLEIISCEPGILYK